MDAAGVWGAIGARVRAGILSQEEGAEVIRTLDEVAALSFVLLMPEQVDLNSRGAGSAIFKLACAEAMLCIWQSQAGLQRPSSLSTGAYRPRRRCTA